MQALTPTAEEKPQGDQQGEGRVMVEAETGVRWSPAKGRQDCGNTSWGSPQSLSTPAFWTSGSYATDVMVMATVEN